MGNSSAIFHVYDPLLIGKRIKKERKALKMVKNGKERSMSQEDFTGKYGEKIGINSYKTLGKFESGNTDCELTIWQLLEFCKIFGCDMGYLLGEYDCKHRKTEDISEATGLSEKAIENLLHLLPPKKEECSVEKQSNGSFFVKYPDALIPPSRIDDNGNIEPFPMRMIDFFSDFIESKHFCRFVLCAAGASLHESYADPDAGLFQSKRENEGVMTTENDNMYAAQYRVLLNEEIKAFITDEAEKLKRMKGDRD